MSITQRVHCGEIDDSKIKMIENEKYEIHQLINDFFEYANVWNHDLLLRRLQRYPIRSIEFYLPQILNTCLVFRQNKRFRFFLARISEIYYEVALKMYFFLQSFPLYNAEVRYIANDIEGSIFKGIVENNTPVSLYKIDGIHEEIEYFRQTRLDYFFYQTTILYELLDCSEALNEIKSNQNAHLHSFLFDINLKIEEFHKENQSSPNIYRTRLTRGLVSPLSDNYFEQIVRLPVAESICFKTKKRTPYLLILETVDLNDSQDLEGIPKQDPVLKLSHFPQTESWEEKSQRIKKTSPFQSFSSWKLRGLIMKSGDDLRQDQLAMQIIQLSSQIFQAENLPIFLRPYKIIPIKYNAGIIEYIPNTLSLSKLKQAYPNLTLYEIFTIIWFEQFHLALKNFTESMAGYSIISYLLKLRDRHNENILIDSDCHIIHIDFGFFLELNPAKIQFEYSPFKLTNEMIEVMGGTGGDMFGYFEDLVIKGFLALRKRHSEFFTLVENLDLCDLKVLEKKSAISEFKENFMVSKSEGRCCGKIRKLISKSINNFSTLSYDYFQKKANKIL